MKLNIFLLALIFIIISVIITLNVFFQQNYEQEMAEQFNRQQLLIAKAVSASIKSHFDHIEEESISFARLLASRGLSRTGLTAFARDGFTEENADEGVALTIVDERGAMLYPEGRRPGTAADIEQFLRVARKAPAGTSEFLNTITSGRTITVVTPVRRQNVFTGAVIVSLSIDAINRRFLAPIKSGERGYAWMMDGSGTLIYHPTQPTMVGKNIYAADKSCLGCHTSFKTEAMLLASPDVGFSAYVSPKGEDKLLAFSRISVSHMSWILCVSIPYSEVTTSIQKSMKLHSMLILSIFLMTVIGAFVVIISNRSRVKAEEKARHLERQRELEREVVHAKDYLENILESTQTITLVMDTGSVVRTVNSAYVTKFRTTREAVLNRDFFEVFPFQDDVDRAMFRALILEGLAGKIGHVKESPVRCGQEFRKMDIILSPLSIHGAISGVILSGIDVTEEAQLKEKIREYAHELEELVTERTRELLREKEKLNAIVESIEAGICIFGSDKRLLWANRVMRGWLSPEKLERLTFDDLYPHGYGAEALHHVVVDNRFVQEVVRNDFGNKQGHFQVIATPLPSPDGTANILALVQDLTEIKTAEEQMMQSEKLSALARLSAGVAHEIGNPLTSISSYVQILKDMQFDDFTRDALETISRHINRIATIVRQMSSFTKTKYEDAELQDVGAIVDSTLQLVKYDKRMKNIRIVEELEPGLPRVKVNGDQLEQVFINIVLNAADAMPEGGSLTIRGARNHNTVDVQFIDTGKGIPRENLERIFDPFFTTKDKGTGLGLSVSYTIVRSFGGSILVESTPEKGTTFTVRLPAHEG